MRSPRLSPPLPNVSPLAKWLVLGVTLSGIAAVVFLLARAIKRTLAGE